MVQNSFRQILLAAIEEGLSTLGDSPKQAILFHLEETFKIKKEQIPDRIEEFKGALEKIFGPGATYLENIIVKRVYEKLSLEHEEPKDQDFLDSVESLKKRIFSEEGCLTK